MKTVLLSLLVLTCTSTFAQVSSDVAGKNHFQCITDPNNPDAPNPYPPESNLVKNAEYTGETQLIAQIAELEKVSITSVKVLNETEVPSEGDPNPANIMEARNVKMNFLVFTQPENDSTLNASVSYSGVYRKNIDLKDSSCSVDIVSLKKLSRGQKARLINRYRALRQALQGAF